MDKNKALRMALEALESLQGGCTDSDDGTVEAITVWCPEVIDAIREALAQPEQESDDLTAAYLSGVYDGKNKDAPQREWVGLTDEEYKNIRYGSDESGERYVSYTSYDEGGYEPEIEIYVDDFARAIEAKLREKNGG